MKSVLCPNAVGISTEHLVPNAIVYHQAEGAGPVAVVFVAKLMQNGASRLVCGLLCLITVQFVLTRYKGDGQWRKGP